MLNITSNATSRHYNIALAVNFDLPIYDILLNNTM